MDIDKKALPTKLLWVDLEMTGLDPDEEVILEVSAKVTDFDFRELATYDAYVKHDPQIVKDRMAANIWWQSYPENQKTFLDALATATEESTVQQQLCQIIRDQFGDEPAVLAGNSIHSDRGFIKKHWPEVDALLHYRMLDVSSLKILMQGKYALEYQKENTHRADDDIRASIAELEFYLQWLRKQG